MNKIFALLFLFSIIAQAKTQTQYGFVWHRDFNGKSQVLKYKTSADNEFDALREAAFFCTKHFRNGKALSEEEMLDLIDVCVNPRSLKD